MDYEVAQLKADGVNTDIQLTGIEGALVTFGGDIIAINDEIVTIYAAINQLNQTVILLQKEIDFIAGELEQRVAILQGTGNITELVNNFNQFYVRDRNLIGNTVNKFIQYGLVGAGLGVVGAIFGFLYNTRMSNMAFNIQSSNFQITTGDRSNLIYQADSQNVLYANQYISNTYNLNVNQGFINSNILTTQTIPIISTLGITVNNTGSATYSLINFSNATNNSAGYIGLGGIVSGYHNNNIIYNTPGAHVFNVPGQNSLSIPAFAINSFGNVGIGINPSAYPLYRLSVDGDIYIHSGKALRANSIIYNSQELNTTLNNYVLKSGSTMTGALTTNSIIYNAQELSTTLNNYLLKSGGVLSGQLYFNTQLYGNPGPYPQGFNGDRILLQTGIGTGYPYSIGIGTGNLTNNTFWFCSPSNASYKWYSGPTNTATLDNTGLLTLPSITTTADLAVNGKTQLLNYTVIGYPYYNFEAYTTASIFADTNKSINLILQSQNASQGAGIITMNNIGSNATIGIGGTSATPIILRNNLYLLSQNGILFNTNNNTTEIPNMIILTNGNVGIGSSNPSSKLYVNGTLTATTSITTPSIIYNGSEISNTYLKLSGGTMTGDLTFNKINLNIQLTATNGNNIAIPDTANNFSTSAVANDMVIRSINNLILQSGAGNAAIYIKSNNNIGLGTNIVNCPLQLKTQAIAKQICLYEVTNNNFNFVGFGNGGGLILQINSIIDDSFIFNVANNSTAATGNNELMRIKGNGNVGIGIANPYTKFHMKGTNPALTIMAQGNSGATSTINLSTYDTTTNQPNCSISATDNGNYGCTFQIKQKLEGADTNGQFTSFIIDKDGNVGIGNNSYSATKLYVNGKARFEDIVTFTTGNWNMSRDGVYRTYYGANSTSYYSCGNDANLYAHYFMKSAAQSYGPIVIMKNDGNTDMYGNVNITGLTRSRNYHNYGTTLDYRTSFDGTNGPGWYFVTNGFWDGIGTVSYLCVAITCLGQNAVWFGRIFLGGGGGQYACICDLRNPNGGTNTINVDANIWNGGGGNAIKITIDNAVYGGQFNIKISG